MTENINNLSTVKDFFNSIILDIENDTLQDNVYQSIIDLYTSYKSQSEDKKIDKENMMKYYTMGLYIYSMLDKNNN